MTGQQIPLPAPSPDRGTPLTHWYIIRKRRDYDGSTDEEDMHSRIFYQAVNLFFLYKLMQINETPKEIRSSLLSDPLYTGNTRLELPENILFFPEESDEDRIARFAEQINRITGIRPDLSVIGEDDFCESLFSIIREESASAGIPLDQVFGFFRYHMKDMQQSYQTSRFITFPETRELLYDTKFDSILKSFFFGLFELAADHNYTEIFYLLFSETGNSRIPVTKKVGLKIRKIQTKASAAINHFIFRKPYPAVQAAVPKGLFSVVRNLTGNIVRPVSYKSARYAEGFSYRSAEKSIFHTLIYNLYLSGREHYMKLFPEDQLTAVIDAIGLFDGMFKVYCDNAAQKQLIDNERGRIELELEAAGKERDLARLSKKQLQQEFIKETAKLKQLGDYISEHARLFSNYFSEEEEINKRIIYLEQSIDKYRNECITLKNLNTIMQNQHSEKVESMSSEIESLKSTWALDQDRFMIEIKNISFQKEKADREISRLKKEINELKNSRILMKKYEKAILDRNIKDSALEKELENLRKEIKSLKIRNTAFINTFCSITGTAAEDISPDELSGILAPIKKDADAYRDQNSFIGLLKDQQKNDRRSLMLNAKLIDDLKEKIERFESQLQNYQDTSSSSQEKDLKEKNRQLGITAIKLQEEVKALRAIINKQK
jgi:hypothetical protein